MKLPLASGLATAAVTITLYPLFEGGTWFWASLGAVLVTTVLGMLSTRFAVPPWLVPPAMLLGVEAYLTAVFAPDQAWARVIPTTDSLLHLGGLVVMAFGDIQRLAAPVPANAAISMITAAGVGLIAMLVDVLAVRLRRAPLAGLPLLALFTVPAAVLSDPIAWPAFAAGALGYVGLLVADGRERLGRWGVPVVMRRSRVSTGTPADTNPLALSGKRVGVTAIALAILVPALVPTLAPTPLFGFGVGNGSGPGGNNIGIPDAIAKLSGQLTDQRNATVLTYASSDDQPRYLRIFSLDVFDGQKWTLSPVKGRPEDRVSEGPLPLAPGLEGSVAVRKAESRITVSEDIETLRFLPLPYPPTQVDVDGDWRADQYTLMVFSTKDDAAGLEYTVVSGEPQPVPDQLDRIGPYDDEAGQPGSRYLSLPEGLDPRLEIMAARITRDADTPFRKAVRLQEWFTKDGGFTYSLQTAGSGGDALSRFVLADRIGYCEQFAGAMAVMARMTGIPARVSIGYTGGTKIGDVWTVRTHDAHAWPELYFEGVGWLRFEPTPSGAAGQGSARTPEYSLPVARPTTPAEGPSAGPTPEAGTAADPSTPAGGNIRQLDRDLGTAPVPVEAGPPVATMIGAGLSVALLLALLPAAARLLVRNRRRRTLRQGGGAAAEAAWAELCDTLVDVGMPREASESPRALARRLAERLELDARASASVTRIASARERLSYARTPGLSGPSAEDLRTARQALGAAVSRRRRIGAALAPSSTLLWVRGLGEKALDAFDLLENVRMRPRRTKRTSESGAGRAGDDVGERLLTGRR